MASRTKRLNEMSDEEWIAWETGMWDGVEEVVDDDEDYNSYDINADIEQEDQMNISGFLGYPKPVEDKKPATTTTTPTPTYVYEKCEHTGLETCVVLSVSGKKFEIAGGSGMSTRADEKTRLILDLAGALDTRPWITSGPAWAGSIQYAGIVNTPILRLDWADRAAPNCPGTWWNKLLDMIATQYEPGLITVACMGGHGRTGTAIAAMILAAEPKVSARDAIEMVRDNHCERAVESASQFWYLYDMRPGESMDPEHFDEIKPVTSTVHASYTPAPTVPKGVASTPVTKWCTWNTWCMKDRNHSGKCKGRR